MLLPKKIVDAKGFFTGQSDKDVFYIELRYSTNGFLSSCPTKSNKEITHLTISMK